MCLCICMSVELVSIGRIINRNNSSKTLCCEVVVNPQGHDAMRVHRLYVTSHRHLVSHFLSVCSNSTIHIVACVELRKTAMICIMQFQNSLQRSLRSFTQYKSITYPIERPGIQVIPEIFVSTPVYCRVKH